MNCYLAILVAKRKDGNPIFGIISASLAVCVLNPQEPANDPVFFWPRQG